MLIIRPGQQRVKPENYSFVVVVDEEMNNQLLSYAERNDTSKMKLLGWHCKDSSLLRLKLNS